MSRANQRSTRLIQEALSVGGTAQAEYAEFAGAVPTCTKSYTYLGDSQLATVTPNGGNEYTEFNHPDRLGTRVIINQQTGGNSEQAHLPFGTALNAESSVTNNNKRFTSYDRSAPTGLDYAINRTYDSKQGRFTQVDPIGMSAVSLAAPQTLNMYTYCGNDPINYVDPSGLFFGKLFKWIWKIIKLIVAVVVALIAVLAFSMGEVWSGIHLAMLSARLVADVFEIKALQKLIAIASIAVSIVRIRLSPSSTVPIFPIGGGEGSGIDLRVVSFLGNVGAIASSFGQTNDRKKKKPAKKKAWCPPANAAATFFGNYSQLVEYEKAVQDMFNDRLKEQGGWIYQNRRGQLKAVRKVREARDGTFHIYLDKPPILKGWRVVGTFHTHSSDFGPSGEDLFYVNGVAKASGDYLPNYRYGVPGLVLTRPSGGGIGNWLYGPARGFHGVGLPEACK